MRSHSSVLMAAILYYFLLELNLILIIVIGGLVYLAVLFMTGFFDRQDTKFLKEIIRRRKTG